MEAIKLLEDNGFEVIALRENLYNIKSVVTGATVARVITLRELEAFATGVEYSINKDVANSYERPIRETQYDRMGDNIIPDFS